MSEIRNPIAGPTIGSRLTSENPTPAQENEPVRATTPNTPIATADTTERRNQNAPPGHVASALPPPTIPSSTMSSSKIKGAQSFASQLDAIGDEKKSAEQLVLAFLKLQVLDNSGSAREDALANVGRLALRKGADQDSSAAGVIQTNQFRAGTVGLGAVLANESQLQKDRGELSALLAGISRDRVVRDEAIVEADKSRHQVAKLVLELIDKKVEANFSMSRDFKS